MSSEQAAPTFPDRATRKRCWAARDAYFKCLDQQQVIDPGTKGIPSVCESVHQMFTQACPQVWAEYFVTKRVMEDRQRQLQERMQNPQYTRP
ncbi:MAG: cytochrome oxidase c subunit VIb-domain-containing protein [Piptocephalis tieghemiana]|nr:MAG: cytochrome oxidase c subunit VIb-domain-containing protein [Piptocephalis tieghemiana]